MLLFFIHLILKFNYIHVSRKQKWLLTMFVLERGGGKGGGEEGGRREGRGVDLRYHVRSNWSMIFWMN